MEPLSIQHQDEKSITILRLDGYVDAATAPQLDLLLEELEAAGTQRIVIDCDGVSYLSSHGIWTLVEHILALRGKGGDIRLARINPMIAVILQDLNVDSFLHQFDDVGSAITSYEEAV